MARNKERIRKEQKECMEYIKKAGSVPAARKLAKSEKRFYPTSDWLGGLNLLLENHE